ncbi:peptide/nickel transport system ATP-binding protein [Pseudoxanthobacter soli DSM 19599]|uniref:Peptide/nickel transport system ATP-binding protein n=1 Tax=Pseudoxanthobacter soli DSM 19599 TaxID=1123029 RepID=A0A1M7ZS02_9HYPH|nr:ABC transporter ATP-binding protein [Pseudoxanthobacter soli]SHO67647.1 peptide/nickel transport system ATP-binding protein [Pseudoxanthobacter soli DSM 19599]
MTVCDVLKVSNLSIDLYTTRAALRPVDGVSYSVAAGETLAIVGESGSGKTVLNFAPLGLMPTGVVTDLSGSILFAGRELVGLAEPDMRRIRGGGIGTIFQDPMSALNPALRIGRQIAEVAELHLGMSAAQAEARALDLLKLVRMSDPEARLRQYPHELSGGLRQRAMIAIAIAAEPKLLIADEPTTALDVTVQAQIIGLLKDLQRRLNTAIVLITHDMGVVASIASRVAVMYAGRLAEYGSVEQVLLTPRHPYTRGLIAALPSAEDAPGALFRGLPGTPPVLGAPLSACAFAPRCSQAIDVCARQLPALQAAEHASAVACHVVNAINPKERVYA